MLDLEPGGAVCDPPGTVPGRTVCDSPRPRPPRRGRHGSRYQRTKKVRREIFFFVHFIAYLYTNLR